MGRPIAVVNSVATEILLPLFLADKEHVYGVREIERLTGFGVSTISASLRSKATRNFAMPVQQGKRVKWVWHKPYAHDQPGDLAREKAKWNRDNPNMKRPRL